jgi:TldD protein
VCCSVAALAEEPAGFDDHPGDLAGRDQAARVADRDGEHQPAAVDLLQHGLGVHPVAHPRRLEVIDLHPHPHRRHPVRETAVDRLDRRLLAQRDHPGGGQDRHGAGAHRDRRVVVADDQCGRSALADICHVRQARRAHPGRPIRYPDRMIEQDVLERVLGVAMGSGGEFAEVYAEDKRSTSAGLDDGRVEQVNSGRDRGAGVRVVRGETTGFAHTSDLSERGLVAAAEAAAAAARGGTAGVRTVALQSARSRAGRVERYPDGVAKADKVAVLQRIDEAARSVPGPIVQVSAGYADSRKRILVANSEGLQAGDEQVRTLVRVSVVADGDTGMQTGYVSAGHTVGFEMFDTVDVEGLAHTAAQQALTKLHARPAPSGALPVVIKAGTGGVLFHEACGHGFEADLIAKGASVYRDKRGEVVASPLVTLVDDGTMAGEWGALGVDDEGHPTQRNVLIDEGVLTEYMWDYLRSARQGGPRTGNGRRQSYMHLPMVRMTNTFVLDGPDDPDEIIRGTDHGVYVAQLGGGQVNTANGDFVFGMVEAYLIENGEITEPLREGNLIGNGPQVLLDIDMLGNDFAMGMPGTCGKDGQGVPVGDGQPTLRVKRLTIGGTSGG